MAETERHLAASGRVAADPLASQELALEVQHLATETLADVAG